MTPFQKKIKSLTRRKFLPLTLYLPPAIEKEKLNELVEQYREMDPLSKEIINIRNTIIEGHLKLGVHIASRYGALYPNKIEDIIGIMGLALTKWVRRARTKLINNNITPYLTTNVHSQIIKFIEEDHCFYMPGRTVRQYIITGSGKIDRMPIQISAEKNKNDDSDEVYSIVAESNDEHEDIIEIKEILDMVTNNFIEKKVIELRAQGYSYKEIEPQVGYSVSSIHIIINNVENKFNKLYKGS